jgi:hypothetical protein
MIAKEYGQDPRVVATWESEWLTAASTVIAAEAGAAEERAKAARRKAGLHRSRGA